QLQPLFSRPSPELLEHSRVHGNIFFITRDTADKTPEGAPFMVSRLVCDYDSNSGHARHFPALLKESAENLSGDGALFGERKPHANLSVPARAYLHTLGIEEVDTDPKTAGLIWMHALA